VTTLKVLDNSGNWQDAANFDSDFNKNNISRPTPSPRLYYLDLTTVFNNLNNVNEFKIRIGFDQRSLDYVAIANEMNIDYSLTTLNPNIAQLGYRGFSEITFPSSANPYKLFNYHQTTSKPNDVYGFQSGNFTKYGNISPLLNEKDDMLAVLRYGDEVALKFNHSDFDSGTKRSLVLTGSIWYKHANKETGSSVEPMPFTGMNNYPYYSNSYPPELEAYKSEWNTRHVATTSNIQIPQMFQSLNFIQLVNGQSSYGIHNSSANVIIDGYENVGGLIGYAYGVQGYEEDPVLAVVSNSSSSGTVKGIRFVGGLIGYAYDLSIDNSNSDTIVGPRINLYNNDFFNDNRFSGNYVYSVYSTFGGLVGYAASGGFTQQMTINNSYFDGIIDFTLVLPLDYDSYLEINNVGGLIGYAYDFVYISQSYATKTNNLNNIIFEITGGTKNTLGEIYIIDIGGLIGDADDFVYLDIGVNQNPDVRRGTYNQIDQTFDDLDDVPYDLAEDYIYYYDITTYHLYIYDGVSFTLSAQPIDNNEQNYNSYSNMNIYFDVVYAGNVYIGYVGGLTGKSRDDIFINQALAKGKIEINVSTVKASDILDEGNSKVEIYQIGGFIGEFETYGNNPSMIYNSSSDVEIQINAMTGNSSYVSIFGVAGFIAQIDSGTNDLFILNGRSTGFLELDAATSGELTNISIEEIGGFIGEAQANYSGIYIYGSSANFDITTDTSFDVESESTSIDIKKIGGFIGYLYGDNFTNRAVNIYGSDADSEINIGSVSNNEKLSVNIYEVGGFIGRGRFANLIDNVVTSEIDLNIFSKLAVNQVVGGYNPYIEISSISGFIGKIDRDHFIDNISVETNIKLLARTDDEVGFPGKAIFIINISGLLGAILESDYDYDLSNFDLEGEILIEAYANTDDKIEIMNIGSLVGYAELDRVQLQDVFSFDNLPAQYPIDEFAIDIKVSSSQDSVNNPLFFNEINKFVGENFAEPFVLPGVTDADPDNVSLIITYGLTYTPS